MRRRYPVGKAGEARAGEIQVIGEHLNLLAKVDYEVVSEIADRIAKAYKDEQIDSVYLIFNEFKSVISQRLIAQRILPVQELGRREVALAEEFTLEARERMGEAARDRGNQPEGASADRSSSEKLRSLPPHRWTTFTSSRRTRCLPDCCRATLRFRFSKACWNR